ncbi:Inositol 1,4,5-trisphosphate receptor type 3, partial [Xenoophorus captivus]
MLRGYCSTCGRESWSEPDPDVCRANVSGPDPVQSNCVCLQVDVIKKAYNQESECEEVEVEVSSREIFSLFKHLYKLCAGMPVLYWFSRRMTLWGTISFNLAVFINLIIAFFYPYNSGQARNHQSSDRFVVPSCAGAIDDSMLLMLFWILTGLSVLGLFSKQYGLQPLTLALILRSIYHLGIGNTLILLGSLNLINKVVFVVSFVGNNGTFIMGYKAMVMDVEFLYHLAYVLTSTLGLFVHELFYSILLFDLIYREETLFNVIKSVTRNGRSILLTALLALILVYLFSILGFLFLKEDFIMEVDPLLQISAGMCRSLQVRSLLRFAGY